ncbi:hypothetical protein GCM10009673_03350 [Nesterenkonia sandarakina]
MRAAALLTSPPDLQLGRLLRSCPKVFGGGQSQGTSGSEHALLVCRVELRRGSRLILLSHHLLKADQSPPGQAWQLRLQRGAGGQQDRDHRRLMRRYWVTAIGAKTAMIATQHRVA